MAITSASPAYQKGFVSGFALPATDQRGYTRSTTTAPSLGAYDPDAKLTPTVTVSDAGGTYKGTGFAATGKAVGANGTTPVSGTFTYAYYVGSTATGTSSSTAPSNAGTYTVVATFTSTNSNYSNSSAETTFTISKANAKVVVTPYTVTYNGVAHTATVTSITGVDGQTGATVGTVTLNSTHTAAGTYATDSWTFAGANYNSIPKTTITDTIKKANATVVVTPYTVTYNGVAHNATVTSIKGVDGQTGATVGTVTLNSTHTAAGTYATDSWSFAGTANYNSIAGTPITDTINKASAKVVVTPYSVTYNGIAHTATVTSITGVDGQTGATVGTVTLNSTHTAAGTYASDSWKFTGTANYNSIASTPITDTINKASAKVVVTPYSVTYNGVAHTATVTSIAGVDGQTGATVGTVTLNTTHTAAGTYATDSWKLTGTANYNSIASTPITDTIKKANATVVVTPYTVTYNGVAHNATVASITGVDGQTGATVGTVTLNTTHTAAGTYATDSWSFAGANYNSIASTAITDTINKANATVVVTPYTVTYDGTAHMATVTSITGVDGQTGATVGTVTLNTTHTNAGTYATDSWSLTGAANYNSIAATTITDTINEAIPTVTVTDVGGTFNGNPFTGTATAVGIDGVTPVAGSFAFVYYTGPDVFGTNLGFDAPSGVGIYTVLATFFSADPNYALVQVSTTFSITQAAPTVAVSDAGGTFDGNPLPATATAVGVDGVTAVAGSFGFTYYDGVGTGGTNLGSTPPTGVGEYTVVADFTSSDADYSSGSAQTTFSITQATPTLSVTDAGGLFTGAAFPATATVAGVDGVAATSLEGVTPSLTYYAGSTATGTPLPGAPSAVGIYTVVASFPGSPDYGTASVSSTFSIQAAAVSGVSVSWGTSGTAPLNLPSTPGGPILPAGRTNDLPWLGIDQITLTFNSSVPLAPGDVTITSAIGADYGPVTVVGSGMTYTITLATPINTADLVTIAIDNASISAFSGVLPVLPGDVDDDGVVDASDLTIVDEQWMAEIPATLFGDITGDPTVSQSDDQAVSQRIGTMLPPG